MVVILCSMVCFFWFVLLLVCLVVRLLMCILFCLCRFVVLCFMMWCGLVFCRVRVSCSISVFVRLIVGVRCRLFFSLLLCTLCSLVLLVWWRGVRVS